MQNTTNNKLLLFQVGPVKCSLFSNDIQTIITPPKQETAGKTGRLPGMFRHNDHIVRVVDVRTKFGLSPSDPAGGRVIIAELPKGSFAFWVDKVLNVIDQEDGRWDILPAALPRDVFTRTFVMDEELILHTECARLEAMTPSSSSALSKHIEALEARQQAASSTAAVEIKPDKPERPEVDGATSPVIEEPLEKSEPATESKSAATAPLDRPESKVEREKPVSPEAKPAPAAPGPKATPPVRPAPVTAPPSATTTRTPAPARATDSLTTRRVEKTVATSSPPTSPRPAQSALKTSITTKAEPAEISSRQTSTQRDEYEDGGMGWIILLVAIIFIAGTIAILYISGTFSDTERSRPVASYEEPVAEPEPTPEPEAVITETTQISEPEPEPITSETQTSPMEAEAETTVTVDETAPTAEEDREFSADIERDDRVLTITLSGPDNEEVRPLLKETIEDDITEPAKESETDNTTPAPVEKISEPAPEPEPVAKPEIPRARLEITHVVVKGDTLWDIAERYVKDPLLYPELARLSGIKNPDRIYPGDVVRIIEK